MPVRPFCVITSYSIHYTKLYELLPLRDIVVFPHMVVPLFIGRDKSIAALEAALAHDRLIFLAAQKDAATNEPVEDDRITSYNVCYTKLLRRRSTCPDR